MIYRAAAVLISSELTELEDGDTNVESFTPEYNADNLTKLTTYRATGKVISTDPSGLKGNTTTWGMIWPRGWSFARPTRTARRR